MEKLELTIELCPAHREQLSHMAEFYGYECVYDLMRDMLAHQLAVTENQMYADLFRLHHEELRQIIKNRNLQ